MSETRVELTIPKEGDCVFKAVSGALECFGKEPLPPEQRFQYRDEIKSRLREYISSTGREEGLGDWIFLTLGIVTEKLQPHGIKPLKLVCNEETADSLKPLNITDVVDAPLEKVAGRTIRPQFPAMILIQNKINPDVSHIWFCSSSTQWKKDRHKELITGDSVVLVASLVKK